jgi:ribonuclease R
MAKKPHDMTGAERLPTREELLAFLKGDRAAEKAPASRGQVGKAPKNLPRPAKIGKRDIAKAFGIKGQGRIALKAMLKELEAEGAIEKRGKVLNQPGHLPSMTLATITSRDRDGDLVAKPVEWDEERHGRPPRIHLHITTRHRPGQPVPAVGDRVLLRVDADETAKGTAYRGRVVKILARHKAQAIGQFRASPTGGGRVIPVDKKSLGTEYFVPPGEEGGAEDCDLVTLALHRKNKLGLMEGRVTERIGSLKSEKAVSLIALHSHEIPHIFPATALAKAEAARPATLSGPGKREDWRHIPLVTIDPADAKDHDDAVYAEADKDPANPDGHIVIVAIADVAAYVHEGSAMDREALKRGNSVYFPDRVVPMLPERISNDLCSLKPDEDRAALAFRMVLGADGRKRRFSVHRVLMRSHAKLAYEEAQRIIDAGDHAHPAFSTLAALWAAWAAAQQERDARSPLELNLPERKLKLTDDGKIDRILVPERLEAHRLIEDFMILANVSAAEILEKHKTPLVYRVHDVPSNEKLANLGDHLAELGYQLGDRGFHLGERHSYLPETSLFNRVLAHFAGTEHEAFVNDIVLRSQSQAEYAVENKGHFGLHLRRYAHFTSPIRRYADLLVHRAIIRAEAFGNEGLSDNFIPQLPAIAAEISACERRAMHAERETIDRLIAYHLSEQIGTIFEGRISGVTRSGLFVKLHESGADGFVPASTIGADYYRYEEGLHALVGSHSGETFRLGDPVSVRLVEAAPVAGALRFEILSEGTRKGGKALGKKKKFDSRARAGGLGRTSREPFPKPQKARRRRR